MILAIRIAGVTQLNKDMKETLSRLKMRRKFVAVLIDEKDEVRMGMLNKVASFVSYGEVSDEIVKKLKAARGKEGKDFFRLHPPVGGFKKSTKVHAPKGVLGKNKDISKLVERML